MDGRERIDDVDESPDSSMVFSQDVVSVLTAPERCDTSSEPTGIELVIELKAAEGDGGLRGDKGGGINSGCICGRGSVKELMFEFIVESNTNSGRIDSMRASVSSFCDVSELMSIDGGLGRGTGVALWGSCRYSLAAKSSVPTRFISLSSR